MRRRPALYVLVACLLASTVACDDQRMVREREPAELPRTATPRPSPMGDHTPQHDVEAIPPEIEAAATEWPLGHRDHANSRATSDAAIDASNVDDLGIAWAMPLDGAAKWGAAASGPLVVDGVVYFQDLRTNTYALDLETGNARWVHELDEQSFGPNGPAVGWGQVYIQNGDHHVVALDMETGEETWKTALIGPTGAHQPSVFDGMVYTALSAGSYDEGTDDTLNISLVADGTSGYAYALDHRTGEALWDFQTVEEGFWGNSEVNSGGGIWFPPAIDTETGAVFWSTGNPGPGPGTVEHPNASSRPGPNLYTNTMLALDGRSGDMLWHNQAKPHDLFHHDFQNPPMLATIDSDDGRDGRDVVIGTGKVGTVFAFDRQTGVTIWETDVGEHQNNDLQVLPEDEAVEVLPGFWGGMETPGAVADGTVYVHTLNLPTEYTADAWGSETADETVDAHEGRTVFDEGTSELLALDLATGDIEWSTEFDTIGFGATTVVNDLVFAALYDGRIVAAERETGEVVWEFQAPGGIIAWPAVVDDTIVWPVGLGREPVLMALRLGAEGDAERPRARSGDEDATDG